MSICRFGVFEFDSQSGEIRKDEGDPTILPPQIGKVLQILTERAGELVKREEIDQFLWPPNPPGSGTRRDTPDDVRVAINRSISKLRERLGDNAEDPAYIETIPHRGFRFIMPVKWVDRQQLRGRKSAARINRKRAVVGRDGDKAQLRDALDWVSSARRGLLVCITGDSGLGKTTLMEDFIAKLRTSDPSYKIACGKCSEQLEAGEGYVPFVEALKNLDRSCTTQEIDLLRDIAPSWYFKIKPPSTDNTASGVISDETRIKRELSDLFERISFTNPLVICLDDFHWADLSSVALLSYIAARFDSIPVLIVVMYRPPELSPPNHPFTRTKLDLQARGSCREIPLELLTLTDIESYLALEFQENDFPSEFPTLLYRKTEGNPQFIVDALDHLQHRGNLANQKGRWVVTKNLGDLEVDLPVGRAMIERKIHQLTDVDRRLLAVASIEGQEFNSAVLASVLPMDPEEVEERLTRLDKVHAFVKVLQVQDALKSTVNLRYRFVHSLYRNAFYESILPSRKALLSSSVANALLEIHGEGKAEIAAQVAALFEIGRDFKRAAAQYELAARHATQGFANREAIRLARRGLQMLENTSEGRDRQEQELALLITLGVPLGTTIGCSRPEVQDIYVRAQTLYKELGDSTDYFPVLAGLWAYYLVRADLQMARSWADQLLQRAQGRDASSELEAHRALGHTMTYLGEIGDAQQHFEQVIGSNSSQHRASYLFFNGLDSDVTCRSYMGLDLWLLGFPDRALQSVDLAVARGSSVSHPLSLALALDFACGIHQLRGDVQRIEERSKALTALAGEHGLSLFSAYAAIWQGWALVSRGQTTEGIQHMRSGIDGCRMARADLSVPHFLGLLAEAYLRAGQEDQGLEAVGEALAVSAKSGNHYYDAELNRLRGELLRARGGDCAADAEACFRGAIDTARRQMARSLELRACISLSRLFSEQGKEMEGRDQLRQVYETFTEGFDTGDVKEAEILLEVKAATVRR